MRSAVHPGLVKSQEAGSQCSLKVSLSLTTEVYYWHLYSPNSLHITVIEFLNMKSVVNIKILRKYQTGIVLVFVILYCVLKEEWHLEVPA